MSRRVSERSRKEAKRTEKPVILVVCEGVTEEKYFRNVKAKLRAQGIEVHKSPESNPVGMVECAEKWLDRHSVKGVNYEVWLVFDAEDAQREAERSYRRAIVGAGREGYLVANSSPNFEYWALIHYCPGCNVVSAKEAESRLASVCGGYEKPSLPFEEMWDIYMTGMPSKSANRQRESFIELGEDPRYARPVTYVDQLVDKLVQAFSDRVY